MTAPLIVLHEEALRMTHPVFDAAPEGTEAIFIWDDTHFKRMDYSLKRLIFIYETLCELPVNIIRGDALDVIRSIAPEKLYVPASQNDCYKSLIDELSLLVSTTIVNDTMFVEMNKNNDLMRFSHYWKKVEKKLLLK